MLLPLDPYYVICSSLSISHSSFRFSRLAGMSQKSKTLSKIENIIWINIKVFGMHYKSASK